MLFRRFSTIGMLVIVLGGLLLLSLPFALAKKNQSKLSFSKIISLSQSKNRQIRRKGIVLLLRYPVTQKEIPALRKLLYGKDAWFANWAAKRLGSLGKAASVAVPDLIKVVGRSKKVHAFDFFTALWRIGHPRIRILSFLTRSVEKRELRSSAMYAFRSMGAIAVPSLTRLTVHHKRTVRRAAVKTLGEMRGKASSATFALIDRLSRERDPGLRKGVVLSLLQIARPGKPISAALGNLYRREPGLFGPMLFWNLGWLLKNPKTHSLPAVHKLLTKGLSHSLNSTHRTLHHMAALQSMPRTLQRKTLRLLRHRFFRVRAAVVKTLPKMRMSRRLLLRKLKRALRDHKGLVRLRAAQALASLGEKASPAVPQLIRVLKWDANWVVRTVAARALGRIGKPRKRIVRALKWAHKPRMLRSRIDVRRDLGNTRIKGFSRYFLIDECTRPRALSWKGRRKWRNEAAGWILRRWKKL